MRSRPKPAMSASSYVRLRGLPFASTEQEVAQWFANAPGTPIQVLRVLFTYNTTGRKSGEAVRRSRTPAAAAPAAPACQHASAWAAQVRH